MFFSNNALIIELFPVLNPPIIGVITLKFFISSIIFSKISLGSAYLLATSLHFSTLLQKAKEYSNSASEDAYVSLVGLKTNIDGQTNEQKENIARVSSELAEQARREQNETSDKEEPSSVTPITDKSKPIVRVKSNKSKDITELVHEDSWKITNEEDLDKYLDELRKNIEQELQHTDILNVDFK